ncbi:hypothetical protein ABEB36_005568 [Hypothenemus hampei]|uniref:E3 ubiquitin-protein ligase SHPRH n=1 Tax=Hypothenemus hampei TaxID=57062 RepID=A0ABD1EYP2_HYPHA
MSLSNLTINSGEKLMDESLIQNNDLTASINNRSINFKYVIRKNLILVEEIHRENCFGELEIGASLINIPQNIVSCAISYHREKIEHFIINSTKIWFSSLNNVNFLIDWVESKLFSFEVIIKDKSLWLKVFLINIPLDKYTTKSSKCLKTAFNVFYNISVEDICTQPKVKRTSISNEEMNNVYQKLFGERSEIQYPELNKADLKSFNLALRPYQEQALQWMIHRESEPPLLKADKLHPLFQKITIQSGIDIYYDKYTGWVEKEPQLINNSWKGGILADEMGLGKTIEVLGLILSNKLPKNKISTNADVQSKTGKVIIIEARKTKLEPTIEDEAEAGPSKKQKVTTESAPNTSKGKSKTFQALQSIYNKTLSEYCTVNRRLPVDKRIVECVCGNATENGSVKCSDCGKIQHKKCLGWKANLGPYKCPQCWEKIDPIESKATLIVTPVALNKQWCNEISTHLKAGIRVLNYNDGSAAIYPTDLQNFDIVLTTYNVLQAELRLTNLGPSKNLRQQRKYWPEGSPLTRIFWWRLCLDEAQTVEVSHSVSAMAQKISARHRWAVTGTPMAKGVSDLFALIEYLQMEPYNDPSTWKHILYNPYLNGNTIPMYEFLSKVLWRTSKQSVIDQINIPQQTHEVHFIEFSAIEKFFYNREHELCCKRFLQIVTKFEPNMPLEKLDKRDLKNLMAPLLSLRRACSDSNAVRGKGRYLPLKKNASSMKDLLESLIIRNKIDCEECLRLIVSSINGLAGIYLLQQDTASAVKEYRKVLQLVSEYSKNAKDDKLEIDVLLIIHAMYNLSEILTYYTPTERTLRDDTLSQDCINLERKYIEKVMKETTLEKQQCDTITTTVFQCENNFIFDFDQWYSDGFDWISSVDLDSDFLTKIEAAADAVGVDSDFRIHGHSTRTMLRKIYNWHVDLRECRNLLCEAMEKLYKEDIDSNSVIIEDGVVEKAKECHLRKSQNEKNQGKTKTNKCPLCQANEKLKDYEEKLYIMKKRAEVFEDMGLEGTWKPRIEELVVKSLLSILKSKSTDKSDLINDGEMELLLLEAKKKEFKEIRKFWTLLDRQVCAHDELEICKVRLQFKTANNGKKSINKALKNLSYEQRIHNEDINLITLAEIPHQQLLLQSEEKRQNVRLEQLLGKRNYLKTLRKQQFENSNPDPCPICQGPLVNTWVILSCAHTYCMDCMAVLTKNTSEYLQCSVCRAKQDLSDVAYIRSGAQNNDDLTESEITLVGDYPRKIEEVLKLILTLRRNDSQVKILLFSTWVIMLNLLKTAFERNSIRAELAKSGPVFEKHIENFKDPLKKITVLLLPIQLGGKGLNLIEATHVILLEPLLNPADELQAIGRIHRIGQTKPTIVHKFVVCNTVEESLHMATNNDASKWEKGKITVDQLKTLFKINSNDVVDAQN